MKLRQSSGRPGISANGLKWIAIAAMFVDHAGEAYMDRLPAPLYFAMRMVGRCTMPIMCFLLAQGFHHTRDRKKYALRLLVFALVAQLPYTYFGTGSFFSLELEPGYFNVLFTLLLGLCALWAAKSNLKPWLKISLAALCALTAILCDWPMFGVLFVLAFGLNFGAFRRQALWYVLAAAIFILSDVAYTLSDGGPIYIALYELGLFLPLPLLALYNGKKANEKAPAWTANKWLFYVIYPLHLAVLGFLHYKIAGR